VGAYVNRFEEELALFCGVRRAVVTVNGTAALHICLLLAGVSDGDEVIIPSLTFVATANAVSYAGAIPHFADADEATLGLDPGKLDEYLEGIAEVRDGGCYNRESGRRIAAIVPMHAFGHPVDLKPLMALSSRWTIPIVEDAAESLGSSYRGKLTGSFGLLNATSFNGNKVMTTGGGGAILTDHEGLADRAKHLTTTAKIPHRWKYEHDVVGYNYRMPNLNAALGVGQLEQMPDFLKRKRALADRYEKAFASVEEVRFVTEPEGCASNYWLNTLVLNDGDGGTLDSVLTATNEANLMTRPAWTPMHRLSMFAGCPSMDLSVTEGLARRVINIPSGPGLEGNQ
jgi:perosamine synthetase